MDYQSLLAEQMPSDLAQFVNTLLVQLPFPFPPKSEDDVKTFHFLHERQRWCREPWRKVELPCSPERITGQLYQYVADRHCREIRRLNSRYLERYYLFKNEGFTCDAHRFIASDPDAPHDHPWNWAVSIQLSGTCHELRLNDRTNHTLLASNRHIGTVSLLRDTDYHRVVLNPTGKNDIWTLFLHPPVRCQGWGFLQPPAQEIVYEDKQVRASTLVLWDTPVQHDLRDEDFRHQAPLGRQVWAQNNEL